MRRLIRNKKGIEIAINFVVMLILAIATLSGSFILINKFFGSAEELKTSIDSQTSSQIRSLLAGGAKVAIPINKIDAHRGDFVTFGVGILNVLDTEGPTDEFHIIAGDCSGPPPIKPLVDSQSQSVKKNDQKILLVGYDIERDTPKGTYICNILVCNTNILDSNGFFCAEPYAEAVYKAYINVE